MPDLPESFEVKENTEERTVCRGLGESLERRSGRPVGVAETSGEFPEWRRLQRKNLKKLGLPKTNGLPQCHKRCSWQGYQSRLCLKQRSPTFFGQG